MLFGRAARARGRKVASSGGGGGRTYATWNPNDKHANIVLSNGNLTAVNSVNNGGDIMVRATIGKSSGKWYWEYSFSNYPNPITAGIAKAAATLSNYVGSDASGYCYYYNGNKYNNNQAAAYGGTYGPGDVIGVALDMDAGTLTFYKNGVSQGMAFSGLSGTFYPAVTDNSAVNFVTANFGATSFKYPVPTGFNAGLYNELTVPESPGVPTAAAGDGQATVSFAASSTDGGSSITGYTVQGVKPDPNLALLYHVDGEIVDDTGKTFNGRIQFSTDHVKFGTKSAYFDGTTNASLFVPDSPDFAFGAGDFTIEGWIFPTDPNGNALIIDQYLDGGSSGLTGCPVYLQYYAGDVYWGASSNGVHASLAGGRSFGHTPINTWTHIVLERYNNVITGYVGGVPGDALDLGGPTALYDSSNPLYIGGHVAGTTPFLFKGYVDEVRITKGVARYKGSFTPPTAPFPAGDPIGIDADAGTTKLSHLIAGLTNGLSCKFHVKATNVVGDSPYSAWSNNVTPVAPLVLGVALFGGGDGASGTVNVNEMYDFSNDARTLTTALTVARTEAAAVGNSTMAVFGGGVSPGGYLSSTSKHTYAGNAASVGTALAAGVFDLSSFSNGTYGMFCGGRNSSLVQQTTTSKYTYSGDVVGAGTALSVKRDRSGGTGNQTNGLLMGGRVGSLSGTGITTLYNHAAATFTNTTSLPVDNGFVTAAGNATVAVCTGFGDATTRKYTYANASVSSGSSLSSRCDYAGGAANTQTGLFAAGYNGNSLNLSSIDKYTFNNDSRVAGTALSAAKEFPAGIASNHAGL